MLGTGSRRVVIEAGIRMGWEKYAGENALFITIDEFGRSAPESDLADYFGFTPDKVFEKIVKYDGYSDVWLNKSYNIVYGPLAWLTSKSTVYNDLWSWESGKIE